MSATAGVDGEKPKPVEERAHLSSVHGRIHIGPFNDCCDSANIVVRLRSGSFYVKSFEKMLGEAAQLGQPMMQIDCIGFGIVPTLLTEE